MSVSLFTGYASEESLNTLQGDRVTIATGDDLCLSVNQFYYTIGLKDEARSDSTCKFKQISQNNNLFYIPIYVL